MSFKILNCYFLDLTKIIIISCKHLNLRIKDKSSMCFPIKEENECFFKQNVLYKI